jgi:hypothetical protein
VTGEDHIADAVTAALRSPALPAEQVGEAAAVSRMLEAMPMTATGRPAWFRSGRGLTIAAVTIAGLGLGGLVAAGAGFFPSAAETPASSATPSTVAGGIEIGTTVPDMDEPDAGQPVVTADTTRGAARASATNPATPTGDSDSDLSGDAVECADGNHGDTVSSIAQATEPGPDHGATVSDAARSDCGKNSPDDDSDDANSNNGDNGDNGNANSSNGKTGDANSDNTNPGRGGEPKGNASDDRPAGK